QNPPADRLNGIAATHVAFAEELLHALPRLELVRAHAMSRGGGVVEIEVEVANAGYLPTMAAMGELSRWVQPLQVALALPEGARVLDGPARRRLPVLAGGGGKAEARFLVQLDATSTEDGAASPRSINVRIWSPVAGS